MASNPARPGRRLAAARFGWGLPAFTIRRETDVVEVVEVRDLATRARLIAVRKRRLTLTATGRAALDEPAQLTMLRPLACTPSAPGSPRPA
ncbi:MAG: hypothetical protein ACT4NY_25075 [Pseudonocardiales bacterium]